MSDTKATAWWRPHDSVPTGAEPAGTLLTQDEDKHRLPLYALILFSFILLLAPQQILTFLAPLRIAMLSIALVCITHLINRLSANKPVMTYPPAVVLTLLLTGWAFVTVPLSAWPGGSVNFLLEKYLKTVVVFLLLVNVLNTPRKLVILSWSLIVMALPLALTAINNLRLGVTMSGSQRIVGYDAPLSENPNDMALLLNLLLPIAIGLLLGTRSTVVKWLLVPVIIIMVIAIVATYSRAGFLTICVTFVCYLILLRSRPQRFLAPLLLGIFLLSLPFLPGDYLGRLGTITNIETDQTGSAQTRLRDALAALRIVATHPIDGSGVGMNTLAMNEVRGETWTEIHNVYLTLAVELGLPGLLLFLCVLGSALRSVRSVTVLTADRAEYSQLHTLAEGLQVSLIAFSVAAFFHPVAYHFYFYYIAGMAVAMGQIFLSPHAQVTGGVR